MYGIIYKITNKINNKIYIGQTTLDIHTRFIQHCSRSNGNGKLSIVHSAIKKYGRDNFSIEEIDYANTADELNKKETYWIEKLNATDNSVGYNIISGGQSGFKGFHHSDEAKKSISEKLTGRKASEESRRRMSQAQKLVKHGPASEETKRKMSQSRLGHKTTEETRKKISNANSGRRRTPEQNLDNKLRQIGKLYMSNKDLGVYAVIFPKEQEEFLSNGWIVGKCTGCVFIHKKELRKLLKTT